MDKNKSPNIVATFGGGFVTCKNPSANIPNPFTNTFSCPANFKEVRYGSSASWNSG